ncbi:ligase-associated DNA damage response endonuclease PdeM [Flavihumibacter sp. R14]|nr:ligase-associated DNA damage response endonuclease PdeM [Flavihumibacter soli]
MLSGTPFTYTIHNQNLLLLPQKAIFWQEEEILIVADVHLGKVGHFRKAGIAIPRSMEQEDLSMLSDIIHLYKPLKIIFLGDLFHSDLNNDWDWLVLWRDLFKDIELILVRGNHDIIADKFYLDAGFTIHDTYHIGPFLLVHEPMPIKKIVEETGYILSGHIHPGVKLRGKGRQFLTLPCFHFGKRQAILPAFGKFTGKFCLRSDESDKIFGVLKDSVVAL